MLKRIFGFLCNTAFFFSFGRRRGLFDNILIVKKQNTGTSLRRCAHIWLDWSERKVVAWAAGQKEAVGETYCASSRRSSGPGPLKSSWICWRGHSSKSGHFGDGCTHCTQPAGGPQVPGDSGSNHVWPHQHLDSLYIGYKYHRSTISTSVHQWSSEDPSGPLKTSEDLSGPRWTLVVRRP